MEKEILFKGKRIDNGEWVYGAYLPLEGNEGRIATSCLEGDDENLLTVCAYPVDVETVCQYTGIEDKNGIRIFVDDICKYYNSYDGNGMGIIGEDTVEWVSGEICKNHDITPLVYLKHSKEWEVIGNVNDNPELVYDVYND